MFKNLWYKVFGHPTVDSVLSNFDKYTAKLKNVADVHSDLAIFHQGVIHTATAARDLASAEVAKAQVKLAKFEAWLS